MKKLLLTSIIAISFATPSMADIAANANSATCNSGTLNTASGTSNLTAQWTPNTINITWDNNNATSGGTGGASTCTYSSSFNIPTTPSRTGYTFGGWTLKVPQNCFANLPAAVLTESFTDSVDNSVGADYGVNATWFANLITRYHWDENANDYVADTTYGRVTGISKCSSTPGELGDIGTPGDTIGNYCWCALTSYIPNGGSQCNISSPIWVAGEQGWEEDCADGCAWDGCMNVFISSYSPAFRRALFGLSN